MLALDALLAVLRDPDVRDVWLAEGRDALLAALPEPEVREALLAVVRGSVILVLARRDVSGVRLVAIPCFLSVKPGTGPRFSIERVLGSTWSNMCL